MDNSSRKISLKKSEPWTDPVTGELYPGGNPNLVQQPKFSQNAVPFPVNSPNTESNSSLGYSAANEGMKFCKFCGQKIPSDAVICVKCGRQVEQLQGAQPVQAPQPTQVYINNSPNISSNSSVNMNAHIGHPLNKWVAFLLCFFLGFWGAHKFYEGRTGMGILYFFTVGLFGIGWFVDIIAILCKPNTYYIN